MRLSAVTPAGMPGDVDVTLINPDGQSAQLVLGFKYVDPSQLGPKPQLFSVTPSSPFMRTLTANNSRRPERRTS